MLLPGRFQHRAAIDGASGPAFMVWDSSNKASNVTLSNGDLTLTAGSNNVNTQTHGIVARAKSTGKYYYEARIDVQSAGTTLSVGIAQTSASLSTYAGNTGSAALFGLSPSAAYVNNTNTGAINTWVATNTVCIAVDLDNSKIWWRTNAGNWNNSGTDNPATNTGGISISSITGGLIVPAATLGGNTFVITANFGATAYAQTPPSGFGNW